ncbi:MAG: DUF1599 domain-containing protein [Bacteroidetes bacterium]|nr:DUF1599 domain-containing protein [Bacteroidota bacterium]
MIIKTEDLHKTIIDDCKKMFKNKMNDYGTSWFILRLSSLTDQILIKAHRIRSIQKKGIQMISDNLEEDFIGIINYSIMALIRFDENDEDFNISEKETFSRFDKIANEILDLLKLKNHDYGEAWRKMRVASMVDIILMKLLRIKQLEDNGGQASFSEGVSSGYKDIINYSVFCLIKLKEKANLDINTIEN